MSQRTTPTAPALKWKRSACIAATSLVLWTTDEARAQCSGYSVDVFAGPDCLLQSFAAAWGISETGAICGGYLDCAEVGHHVIWSPTGEMTEMPPSAEDGIPASPAEINSANEVVGRMHVPGLIPPDRAFLYSEEITINLGTLPGGNYSEATAIAEDGTICGYSHNTGTGPLQAFVWQDGHMSALDLPYGTESIANDISDDGMICGWMGNAPSTSHAFVWKDGVAQDLGVIPGGLSANAMGISNNGQVCGAGVLAMRDGVTLTLHAFYWANGTMTDLGTLNGLPRSTAIGINDLGHVIGRSHNEFLVGPAFIWHNGVMHNLNDLIPPELGLDISLVWDISNSGQIVGQARVSGTSDQVAVRLTPIPSPIGDSDCDKDVDVDDLLTVINHWADESPKGSSAMPPADFNHDRVVNALDLLIVIDNWTP